MYVVTVQEMVTKLEELVAKHGQFFRPASHKDFDYTPVEDVAEFVKNAIVHAEHDSVFWNTKTMHKDYTKCPEQALHEVVSPRLPAMISVVITVHDPETMTYSRYAIRMYISTRKYGDNPYILGT
jgi:hypothetical protein